MAKTKKTKTKVLGVMVVDRSGSMSSCKEAAEKGVNDFFTERLASSDLEEHWALFEFDDRHDQVFEATPIADVPKYILVPRGMTALHDAIGKAVNYLAGLDSSAQKIVVIMTDGFENSSKEFNSKSIKKLIESKKDEGWQIVFLGANQDAVTVGVDLGVNIGTAMTFDVSNTPGAMSATSNMLARGMDSGVYAYSGQERLESVTKSKSWISNGGYKKS